MDTQNYVKIRDFVQNFLVKSRLDLKYSLEMAGHLLNVKEPVLEEYESGKLSPPCYELFKILRKYQADLDQFALELALLQMNINLTKTQKD